MLQGIVNQNNTIEHFIIQLMHNIQYVGTIKIIKYLKVLQHVSDHRRSIIREPCTVKKKLRGLSPHANYTDRAAAAGRRS